MSELTGYLSEWSVAAGASVSAMLSSDHECDANVQLVKLNHGDDNPQGPGFLETEIDADFNGGYAIGPQLTRVGNLIEVTDQASVLALTGDFTLWALVWPGTVDREQIILARQGPDGCGYALAINAQGQLELQLGDGQTTWHCNTSMSLVPRQWMLVAASVEHQSGKIILSQWPVENSWGDHLAPMLPSNNAERAEHQHSVRLNHAEVPFTIAARWSADQIPEHCYNGKLDRCGVYARAVSILELEQLKTAACALTANDLPVEYSTLSDGLIAAWDPSLGLTDYGTDDQLQDSGPHKLHGAGINKPVRAMTGYNWHGDNECYRLAPEQFGALHCHEDAIEDALWQPSLHFNVPDNLKSGVYALRVTIGDGDNQVHDHIPFFVVAQAPGERLAVILPTATYLANANQRRALEPELRQGTTGEIPIISKTDYLLCAHPEYGLSTRDCFIDGAGVCFSSRLRPLPTVRPRHRDPHSGSPRHLAADLSLLWWLQEQNIAVDLLTDEQLHKHGAAMLNHYDVVIGGSQAEVASPQMLDALEDYLEQGGRYISPGGHGLYWVGGFAGDSSHLVEIRQLDTGSRDWQSQAGEYYLASSGERGGLWRHRGRAPQKLLGAGFTSEGSDVASYYERMPDAWHRMYHWLFEGVPDVFGETGLALDGAAGADLDRYDWTLGTPQHARIMASSAGHSDMYPVVHEDLVFNFPGQFGTWDDKIRADIVLFTTRNQGAVFTAGSSAFAQSLPVDKGTSRMFRNLLDAFLQSGPLPGATWSNEEKHWR